MKKTTTRKVNRKQEILETLAMMLETSQGSKITTSALAEQVSVSEAALYRHFPSKARMFDGLFDFTEEVLFSRVSKIVGSGDSGIVQCKTIIDLTLQFFEINPGLCRLITGDALVGEHERLSQRSVKIIERLETELKQVLRNAEVKDNLRTNETVGVIADLFITQIRGRLLAYVGTGFKQLPSNNWLKHWQMIESVSFR